MDKLSRLKYLAKQQNRENGLPDYILDRILIIDKIDDHLLDQLQERVEYFNSDAGIGCFSDGYSVSDIEKILNKL
ncbi:MAG: hypothetical protein LDL13_04490 [Calditerrivibrio sp.]|nr:hypothetical protein [Calditerrivibrio sp.]